MELSPFTVSTDRDTGFVAASSLAGGRLSSDLRDTAADYSVLTAEFLSQLNLTNLSDAVKWTVGANNIVDTTVYGGAFGNDPSVYISFRGSGSNGLQLDFFPAAYDYDTFSVERLDFARGANAVLFGAGSFSGTPNAVAKRARLGKRTTELRFTVGSFDLYRATVDVNLPLARNFAARLNILEQRSGGFYARQLNDRRGAQLGLRFDPTRTTTLNLSSDVGKFRFNTPQGNQSDSLTGWDGRTVSNTPQFLASLGSNAQGAVRDGTTNNYILNTTGDLRTFMNYSGQALTLGAGANAQVPVGGRLYVGTQSPGISGQPMANAINVPANLYDTAEANSEFRRPGRRFSNSSDGVTNWLDYRMFTGTVNQQIGKHLFLEAAGNYSLVDRKNDLLSNGTITARLDINRVQPDGTPNPWFLHVYDEANISRQFIDQENIAFRTAAVLQYDKTRWGDFRLSLMGGENFARRYVKREVMVFRDPTIAPRLWASSTTTRARYYWDQPRRPSFFNGMGDVTVVNPVTGITRTLGTSYSILTNNAGGYNQTTTDTQYWQAAVTGKVWRDRFNVMLAARHDDFFVRNDQNLTQLALPVDNDGSYVIHRPGAPKDYNTLTYTPKNSAGVVTGSSTSAVTRPRDSAGNPLPQYANDRFQDDYRVPDIDAGKTVYSVGSVFHATQWMSLQASYGETYSPPSSAPRIDYRAADPVFAKTTSGGFRFYLLDGKVTANISRYRGTQINTSVGMGTADGFPLASDGVINNLINSNKVDDLTPDGKNQRGLANVPQNFRDIAQREIRGTEIEVVANLSRSWRLMVNASFPEAVQTNANSDMRDYIDKNLPELRGIVTDAGGLIGSDNVAVVDNSIDSTRRIDSGLAVAAWNNLMAIRRSIITGEQKVSRLSKYQANLYSDYILSDGRLKGLRIGAGVNVRGPEIIGNRSSDTIRSPSNPAVAIDDPDKDATTPVWRYGYHTLTTDISYTFKVLRKYSTTVQLRVDNLLNYDKPLYTAVIQRPPGGDITTPARVATPNTYGYVPTRTWQLSTTVRF